MQTLVDLTMTYYGFTDNMGVNDVNCSFNDISLGLLKSTFNIPTTRNFLKRSITSRTAAPMDRKPGTRYSFNGYWDRF